MPIPQGRQLQRFYLRHYYGLDIIIYKLHTQSAMALMDLCED
jgi:hypothetical protein